MNLVLSLGIVQGLRISIDSHKFHPFDLGINHPCNSTVSGTSHTDHFDLRKRLNIRFDLRHKYIFLKRLIKYKKSLEVPLYHNTKTCVKNDKKLARTSVSQEKCLFYVLFL